MSVLSGIDFQCVSSNNSSSPPSSSSSSSSSPCIVNSPIMTPSSVANNQSIVTSTASLSRTPRTIAKAKRSLVWRYFNVLPNDVLHVECTLCSTLIFRKTTSTSNLLYHLQTQHSTEYQKLNKYMKSRTRTSDLAGRLPLTSDRSLYLTKLIADLIIRNFLPLSIVESAELQSIFYEAEPSYVIPNRKYFTNNVLKNMYAEVRKKVLEELRLSPGICLTTDIWTSDSNQAYMTVTTHFIDTKCHKIKCFVLETKEFSGNHTAERIGERLEEICHEWYIYDNIVCLVSDNCNTMKKVGNDFGKGWIGCNDHLINLTVNDVVRKLDEVKTMLVAVRHIVSFTRVSHLANEMLNKYQRSLGFTERQLIFDVVTRWNSTFYMLERFIEEKVCITACLNEKLFQKHFHHLKISKVIEWDYLEQLVNVLEPFEAATRKLASDSLPTLSITLPVITVLITSLEDRTSDCAFLKKIKSTLRIGLEERFSEIFHNKLALLCTALDPRWKEFACLQRSLYQNYPETLSLLDKLQAFEAKKLAYSYLEDEFSYLNGTTVAVASNSTNDPKGKQSDFFDIMVTSNCSTSSNNPDSELFMYENERELQRSENPLEWWFTNKTKYPLLSQLAFKYLCITATSVPSERMFSTSGHLTSDRRSRLTPDTVDTLLFLKHNS